MPLNIMRQGIESACKTRLAQHTNPSWLIARNFEARCEQFQQAQAQGRAHFTTFTTASSSHSSLHANTQSTTTCQPCSRCGYSHLHGTCPAFKCECYNCHTTGHLTALCRRPSPIAIKLIPPTRGGSPKADSAGPAITDIQEGHIAEEGSHAEATPEIEETSAPVTAHLRTIP